MSGNKIIICPGAYYNEHVEQQNIFGVVNVYPPKDGERGGQTVSSVQLIDSSEDEDLEAEDVAEADIEAAADFEADADFKADAAADFKNAADFKAAAGEDERKVEKDAAAGPDYAYNHPLYSSGMKIYSDASVSDFFKSITKDKSTGFLNEWNAKRNRRERIYISYDSTNKNCQAGEIELAEFGHAKTDIGSAIINYSVGYDLKNKEPLFYEAYPGSINDVSQLRTMLGKITGYGYKKIGFILDRGYFSRGNIRYLDECGYSFVIMAKGMSSFISDLILENKGTFENKRSCDMNAYGVYGKTVQRTLFEGDEKKRYIHIYHSISKDADEREHFENALRERTALLMSHQNETVEFGSAYEKYFYLHYDKDGVFLYPEEKTTVTEREISLCGYFVIITSERMTAKEALHLYKSRDVSEKLFASDKSFLGNKSMRSHTNEGVEGRIFTQFIALIIRNKIYTALQEENEKLEKKQNYMTVPAALKELEKIEMVRQLDNIYRLDHAVTAKQKKILEAFGMNEGNITYRAGEISNTLKKSNIQKERR